MPRIIDQATLMTFAEEVQEYLPKIRLGLETFVSDPTQRKALQDTHRYVHTIKGASAMIGLSVMSHMTYYAEELLDEVMAGQLDMTPQLSAWIQRTVNQAEHYLNTTMAGEVPEQEIARGVVQSYRRLRGLPEDGDAGAIAAILAEELADATTAEPTVPAAEAAAPRAPEVATPPTTARPTPDTDFDMGQELVEDFLLEAEEYLDAMGRQLPEVKNHPEPRELLQNVRRSVHTLKGAAGVIGFRALSQLSHRMEDLLDEIYDGKVPLTDRAQDVLMRTFDTLDDFVRGRSTQADFDRTAQGLYATYAILLDEAPAEAPAEVTLQPEVEVVPEALQAPSKVSTLDEEPLIDLSTFRVETMPQVLRPSQPGPEAPAVRQPSEVVRVPIERLDELMRLVGELVVSRSTYEQHVARLTRQVDELSLTLNRLRRVSERVETQSEMGLLNLNRDTHVRPAAVAPNGDGASAMLEEFDELEFDRYSDFALASRELIETTADVNTLGLDFGDILGDFDSYLTRQARLTSEVQDKLMRLRMVPMAMLSTRLQRTVRVTAQQQNKRARLVIEGEEVELDKTILEEIAEPLLHILRNAVDHGLEPPALRQALGKTEEGEIRLRAYTEGTQVVIQVNDDGAGLEPQLLRASAVRSGFATEEEVARMSTEQLYGLIFTPGFSTAQQISEVSGRGIGMDVVQDTITRLKGRVALNSTPGQGTAFTMRLPLTMALTRVLLVQLHEQTFALPLADVVQILRLETGMLAYVGEAPVLRHDGSVLPVLKLGERLGTGSTVDSPLEHSPVVVMQAGEKQVACVVDGLLGVREVVVKSLGSHLRRVNGIIGATLMGDGSVVLILNPIELVQENRPQATVRRATTTTAQTRQPDAVDVLVVDDSFSVRRVVSNVVQKAGWHPIPAKDGLEALEIIQRAARLPDVVLLDIEMPQMDGYEFTSTLRANAAYQDIPIIMLTSRSGEKHRQKAFEVGATDYLVKPYDEETLLNTVRRLVPHAGGTAVV